MTVDTLRVQEQTDYFVECLERSLYCDPHSKLGLHSYDEDTKVIRLWRPGASHTTIEVFGDLVQATRVHDAGLFEYHVPGHTMSQDYKVFHQDGSLALDPYAFTPTFGEVDQHLFGKGQHYELYRAMGARVVQHEGCWGTKFSVWAPSAKKVALVSDFNYWNGCVNPMRSMGGCGVWELFIPGVTEGMKYKFEIITQQGNRITKSDPYAYYSEMRPSTASVVFDVEAFEWSDSAWVGKRKETCLQNRPMNIYEVHLGSWNQHDGSVLNYREIAHRLADYCKHMGFTHVELLPVSEHPLDESWGYQVSGYYSITSRYGDPRDFQYFVNYMHQNDIGVIVDWVPGHFPMDDFSFGNFDGTCLYEHQDPRQGFHPHWKTYIFNYGRNEVSNFLLANALFWFERMHVDGLRVDAVASMLYLDYGRDDGEWIPNCYGGKENLAAIEFIKHLNSIVHERNPGVAMIAEESTSFAGVTTPVHHGGLGFDMKWNMGWMNDTLSYFNTDPIFRTYHHQHLTFGLLYAFSENFTLVLSHDEIVHGKGSLLSKMPGDDWQKFANLRLLYSYMVCQPGKNLLFMGGEIGEWNEWNCKYEIAWPILKYPSHLGMQTMVRELNHLYLEKPCLWEKDFNHESFIWTDFSDTENSIINYRRLGHEQEALCIHNFTPQTLDHYYIPLPNVKEVSEIFNSDNERYGGTGKENHAVEIVQGYDGNVGGIKITVAPLATSIFEVKY